MPTDGVGPIGTLANNTALPAGVTFAEVAPGVYVLNTTNSTDSSTATSREALLNDVLNDGIDFTPRSQLSGVYNTPDNSIVVKAVSTERATGGQVADGSFGGPDGTSKTETVIDYIYVTIEPDAAVPLVLPRDETVFENNNRTDADDNLVVDLGELLHVSADTVDDLDGSQS